MTVRAAAFSGGGADGAFQAGALCRHFRLGGEKFHHLSGTSTGALSATWMSHFDSTRDQNMIAQLLRDLYLNDLNGNKSIYSGGSWIGSKVWNLLTKGYIHDPKGLRRLLNEYIKWNRVQASKVALTVGVTNVRTGEYFDVSKSHPKFADYVLASASMPVLFPTVHIDGEPYVDGGVKSITPLSSAVKFLKTHPDPDKEMYVFLASPVGGAEVSDATKGLPLLGRTISLLTNAIYEADLDLLHRLNSVDGYAKIKTIVHAPLEEFGDALDFDPKRIARTVAAGELTPATVTEP